MRSLKLCVGGVDLVAMIAERDGEDMVAVRPICEALGLSWPRQSRKLESNQGLMCCLMATHDTLGREQQMLCIPIKYVAFWLCTINSNKVKEQHRSAVITFQKELQYVLHSYVRGDLTPDKMDMLLRAVEELKTKVIELASDNVNIKADNVNLKADNVNFKADNAKLRADNAELRKQFEEFEYGADTIATRYASAGAHAMLAVKARKRHLRIAVN